MTPAALLRTLLPSRIVRAGSNATLKSVGRQPTWPAAAPNSSCDPAACVHHCKCFAHVESVDSLNRDVFFSSTAPWCSALGPDHRKPPDERTLRLGKTVRTLHERLPSLLQSPLPSEMLSPQISLHLFPSTHPHLPTVTGRIGYVAALWTAPVAWGRVPLVGNVKLTILSERMVRNGGSGENSSGRDEKLIVKWKTCGKTKHRDGTGGMYRGVGIDAKDPVDRIRDFIAGTRDESKTAGLNGDREEEFCGIFVFDFDEKGRIVKHVIEHTDEGGYYDKMTRVVSVTDWLLSQFNGKGKENVPALALCEERPHGGSIRMVDRRQRSF